MITFVFVLVVIITALGTYIIIVWYFTNKYDYNHGNRNRFRIIFSLSNYYYITNSSVQSGRTQNL